MVCALFATCASLSASALDANHFTQTSRLAQGRWVKVAVSQTGIYEIDQEQLAEMGFTDPTRVNPACHPSGWHFSVAVRYIRA